MDRYTDADIDPAPLEGKRVAIIGFGNQGRAQALNLRDSGVDVVVGLRPGSSSAAEVSSHGLAFTSMAGAAANADIVMLLTPDEVMAAVYDDIAPSLRQGAALGFSHGLAIRFGFVSPRADLDVFLVAPKGPGTALRSLYTDGRGMLALFAVPRNASGRAEHIALAYARAIGAGRAGVLRSSFEEECEADLFNEHAVVWGGVPELLIAGFDTLVEAGISPEVAYLECVGELGLLAELIERRGIAGMREAISNTAELSATIGGPQIIDAGVRERMKLILKSVRDGSFAEALAEEADGDYPMLRRARAHARSLAVEKARDALGD